MVESGKKWGKVGRYRMFFGEFEYRVDEKGRVPLPAQFRREIKDGMVVLSQGMEGCITVYTMPEWKKMAATLTGTSITRSKLRRLNRALFSTAFRVNIDGQGRVALPGALRDYAGIDDGVVIIGANNCIELWNGEHWEAEKADSWEQAWQIIESLEMK
jgi:MraZ protein